jgi:hypothetical protein
MRVGSAMAMGWRCVSVIWSRTVWSSARIMAPTVRPKRGWRVFGGAVRVMLRGKTIADGPSFTGKQGAGCI